MIEKTGKRIGFWDTTLRDGHQSLWATRMTSEMMEPIIPAMDEAGYDVIGIAGAAVFDSCIYYLAEDPWERLAMVHSLSPKTPKSCYIRSLNILGWDIFADDAFDLTIRTLARYGVRVINAFDSLNDTRNMEVTIKATLNAGLQSVASLVFSESPVHTDEDYVKKAKELVAMGVGGVQLKDSGALLTPARVASLTPKLRSAIGAKVQLHFHTHCTSGLGTFVTLDALQHGVDVVHAAVSPLANGTSNPPIEIVAYEARHRGYDVPLDMSKVEAESAHFREVAIKHGKPIGQAMPYDPGLYRHQVPGGMMSNLRSQLEAKGLADRFDELLDEITQVRRDLGYPIMVSPMSQFIGVQALFNVLHQERYKVVPAEIKNYALGWYGQHPAPMDPDVYDRISGGETPISGRPGDHLEPMLESFRRQHGPFRTDEELVLALHYKPKLLEDWRVMRSGKTADAAPETPAPGTPAAAIRDAFAARGDIAYAHVRRGKDAVTYRAD